MEESVEQHFLRELVHQAETTHLAALDFNAALGMHSAEGINRLFAAVQQLLGAAALVSKVLWPPSDRGVSKRRGQHLRAALSISEGDFVSVENRKVRDSFEHFDERLESFLAERPDVVFDRNVGPRDAFVVNDEPARHLRFIDPGIPSVSVLGVEANLNQVVKDVGEIGQRAAQRLAKSARAAGE